MALRSTVALANLACESLCTGLLTETEYVMFTSLHSFFVNVITVLMSLYVKHEVRFKAHI